MNSSSSSIFEPVLLSQFFGSLSLFIWIVVFTPQIFNNWKYKNASSVSFLFIFIWLLSSLFSVVGALIAKMLFTTIVLTFYLIMADIIIIFQIWHYRPEKEAVLDWKTYHKNSIPELTSQITPLIDNNRSYSWYNQEAQQQQQRPPSHSHRISIVNPNRVSTLNWKSSSISINNNSKRISTISTASYPPAQKPPTEKAQLNVLLITLCVLLFLFIIVLVYYNGNTVVQHPKTPQVFGWISAILSNCARIPQIKMNYKRRSIEGLSLLMFVLSLTGNITFALSVLLYSNEHSYLVKNLPWIAGTIMLCVSDSIILAQFYLYWNNVIYFEIEEEQQQQVNNNINN